MAKSVDFFTLVRAIHAEYKCVYVSKGETLDEHLDSQEPKGDESVHIYWGAEQYFHLYNADSSDPDIDDHHAQFNNWALDRLLELGWSWMFAAGYEPGFGLKGSKRASRDAFVTAGPTKYEAIARGLMRALEVKANG